MKKVFENKFKNIKNAPTIKIIENWSDTVNIENIDFRENPEICQNKILIQYAGNIGRTQGLIEFINVISKVKIKNFVFHLWGDGALLNELKKHVEDLKLNDVVKFFGSYTRAEQNKVLNLTDISLVTLSDGMYGLGVPSKAYNILSTGKPILYIGHMQSEIALMVKEHEIGFCFDSNNLQKLVEFLTNLSIDDIEKLKKMGDKARYISEFNYNESKILLKYLEII